MSSRRLTRRGFVVAGAASAAVAAASAAGDGVARGGVDDASAGGNSLIVARFVRAEGPRLGVVSIDSGEPVSVKLDSGAFVAHGADGGVAALTAFVPGEPVVIRGDIVSGEVAAVEFQSVYTSVSGTYQSDAVGHWLVTPSKQRVRVPERVLRRDVPAGIARGEARTAMIWTHPVTGEATAVQIA